MRRHATTTPGNDYHQRLRLLQAGFLCALLIVLLRLGYWQILKHNELSKVAAAQYESWRTLESSRGSILDSQGQVLATNEELFTLFAEPNRLTAPPSTIAQALAPIIVKSLAPEGREASDSAWWSQQTTDTQTNLNRLLSDPSKKWVALAQRLSRQQQTDIQAQKFVGLGFDAHSYRYYPDASVSAHLLGFVGKDSAGQDQGYFGLEGFYDLELQGLEGRVEEQQTARGLPIAFSTAKKMDEQTGRDLVLTINKATQFQVEQELKAGIEKYGATSGDAVVMDPHTGAIIAMASYPNYNPQKFLDFDPKTYRNPVISDLYEPGSTLKVLTVAAGVEDGKITPDTTCPRCSGPRIISGFPIRTWNEEYHPNISMRDALAKSDNTAMVFIQEELGKDRFLNWLRLFGLDGKTDVDLQGETKFEFRADNDWRQIDVATAAFGQGVAVTSLNLLRAVAAIANGGVMMRPYVVQSVKVNGQDTPVKPEVVRQVVSAATAKTVTDMMVYSAQQGDSKWTISHDINVAGKTGTAQISENGKYLTDKTNASFIGFAPAENPKFVMLVKLNDPKVSEWGSETAAPIWYKIMRHLL